MLFLRKCNITTETNVLVETYTDVFPSLYMSLR